MNNPVNRWPEDLEQALRSLWAEGLSYGVIQLRMNAQFGLDLTRLQIAGKATRLGLRRNGARTDQLPRGRPSKRAPVEQQARHIVAKVAAALRTPPPLPAPSPAIEFDDEFPPEPGVGIMELGPNSCRWPIDPKHRLHSWRYCGAACDPRSQLSQYCTEHWLRSRSASRLTLRKATGVTADA